MPMLGQQLERIKRDVVAVISDGLSEKDFVALNTVELLETVDLPDAPPPASEQIAGSTTKQLTTPTAGSSGAE